jgi:hypothetical protein
MGKINQYVLALALLSTASSATADDKSDYQWNKTIRANSTMCTTKEFLDEFIQAKVEGNRARVDAFINQGLCAVSTSGLKIKVLSGDWDKANIRIISGGKMTEAWVNSSSVLK